MLEQYTRNVTTEFSFCSVLNTELRSDGEKKGQIESLKQEIGSLKEQILQQQQELHAKTVQVRKPGCYTLTTLLSYNEAFVLFLFVLGSQEKEQQSSQKELLRELERFKAEEMARMERKIEDSRDHMRREMEFLYTRNIHALNVKKAVIVFIRLISTALFRISFVAHFLFHLYFHT